MELEGALDGNNNIMTNFFSQLMKLLPAGLERRTIARTLM